MHSDVTNFAYLFIIIITYNNIIDNIFTIYITDFLSALLQSITVERYKAV